MYYNLKLIKKIKYLHLRNVVDFIIKVYEKFKTKINLFCYWYKT